LSYGDARPILSSGGVLSTAYGSSRRKVSSMNCLVSGRAPRAAWSP